MTLPVGFGDTDFLYAMDVLAIGEHAPCDLDLRPSTFHVHRLSRDKTLF